MEIPLDRARAAYLLEIVKFYTSRENVLAESWEAKFLIDLINRLKRRLRRP